MNSKRWLFPCLFRVFMIQISINTQGSVNGCSSGSTAPITGADSLVSTGIVIQYYSDNIYIFYLQHLFSMGKNLSMGAFKPHYLCSENGRGLSIWIWL